MLAGESGVVSPDAAFAHAALEACAGTGTVPSLHVSRVLPQWIPKDRSKGKQPVLN